MASTAIVVIEGESLLFGDFDDLAAFILAAVRANAVGNLGFVAIGTLGENRAGQRVVRPAGGGTALGMTSFWVRHRDSLT
jgi:hypothetical protein